ncbi:MAG: hypothetical protein AB7P04_15190 [Bacteriovoracia bacterium]
MISEVIRKTIEDETNNILAENRLVAKVKSGQLDPRDFRLYLYNLKYAFSNTPPNLERAARLAAERGHSLVSEFMLEKLSEEIGHDLWPEADLKKTSDLANPEGENLYVTQATKDLMDYTAAVVTEDPRVYLSYLTFTEYFTVLAAPQFLQDMEDKCGIAKDKVSAIANHEESDREHSKEDFKVFDQLEMDDQLREQLVTAVKRSARLVGNAMNACVQAS